MKYIIDEKNLQIDCKLAEKEKTIKQCKECPSKKNCNDIEKSIKKDLAIKNDIEFKKFIYNEDYPECKTCLLDGKKINNCKQYDRESTGYK